MPKTLLAAEVGRFMNQARTSAVAKKAVNCRLRICANFMDSHFDLDDLADHQSAHYHHPDAGIDQLPPRRIVHQDVGVTGIGKTYENEHDHRQQAQNPAGKPSLGGTNAQLTLDTHAI